MQTIEILTGNEEDGMSILVPEADYEFDPRTGKETVIEFDAVSARFVMIRFTGNTGAVAGQAGEVQTFSE